MTFVGGGGEVEMFGCDHRSDRLLITACAPFPYPHSHLSYTHAPVMACIHIYILSYTPPLFVFFSVPKTG